MPFLASSNFAFVLPHDVYALWSIGVAEHWRAALPCGSAGTHWGQSSEW